MNWDYEIYTIHISLDRHSKSLLTQINGWIQEGTIYFFKSLIYETLEYSTLGLDILQIFFKIPSILLDKNQVYKQTQIQNC